MTEVPLRDYIEAVLDEQRRGMLVAEQEREKAAEALRIELARAIADGDRALRDHIEQQMLQIRAALISAETLELQRIGDVSKRLDMLNENGHAQIESRIAAVEASAEQHVAQLRRERELVTNAQMQAIAKAESATEKRFESVNEFREQLTDAIARFLPREVAEAQINEVRKVANAATDRLNRLQGLDAGETKAKSAFSSQAQLWIGALGLLVAVLTVVVVVILANGAGP